MNQYQAQALRTAKAGDTPLFDQVHAAMGLAGEAGEFADCIKKAAFYGKPLDRENAIEELGDLLWYIALACRAVDVTMQQVADANIAKLTLRYPDAYSDAAAIARADKTP